MSATAANGWIVSVDAYTSANWSMMASTTRGPYAYSAGGVFGGAGAGLFD